MGKFAKKQTPSPTLTLIQNISFSAVGGTPARKPSHGMIMAGDSTWLVDYFCFSSRWDL